MTSSHAEPLQPAPPATGGSCCAEAQPGHCKQERIAWGARSPVQARAGGVRRGPDDDEKLTPMARMNDIEVAVYDCDGRAIRRSDVVRLADGRAALVCIGRAPYAMYGIVLPDEGGRVSPPRYVPVTPSVIVICSRDQHAAYGGPAPMPEALRRLPEFAEGAQAARNGAHDLTNPYAIFRLAPQLGLDALGWRLLYEPAFLAWRLGLQERTCPTECRT